MPTALIADDEPNLSAELASRLAHFWPELQIVAISDNGVDALAELNAKQPDFAFLDIRMPGVDGLQIARLLSNTRAVFVTAYDEYAVQAFETSAVDYLLKPLNDERLLRCIAKLQRGNRLAPDLTNTASIVSANDAAPIKWLTVGLKDATHLVSIDDVLYFKATDKYTEVVTRERRHIIRTSLKDLVPRLDADSFAQVHRSAIVAYAAIDRVERDLLGRFRIHLVGCADLLPVSRACVGLFKQM
ncbi:LytR/AlgR family response regulator transcription factor [Paraburkholderia sp. HP33-1]|uniref:LytR/AlgR family response regulator transcription factor n=1 Tax=Paraburkholderia sp. HP33-1 TaxID=2883243 RepID=UPI001F41A31F|nr:LytTR family DNA-binding domain-containing protein [Paraburkholderia sp. HP33-1]